jgi:hypothetical protein
MSWRVAAFSSRRDLLSWREFGRAVVQVDQQLSLDHLEKLVVIVVLVATIGSHGIFAAAEAVGCATKIGHSSGCFSQGVP